MSREMFAGEGDVALFLRTWRPVQAPRAVVVIVHGYKAHSGLYEWAAARLVEQGLAVYALDLRGHGKSEGARQSVEKFTDYVADVHKLVGLAKSREPGLPVFMLAHSAGGVIACSYALEHQAELAGLVCESFAHEVPAPEFVLAILKGISYIAPRAHVLALKNEDYSRDPAFVERLNHDPLIDQTSYPAHAVAEMVRADERLKRDFPLITLPVLIVHGTADKVTLPSGSQRFYDTAGSRDKTLKLYEGHVHDLLNDLDREVVMADIVGWISQRIEG